MAEFAGFALSVLALALLIFGTGAILGWSWAVKSLEVPPPRWIAGVLLAAGIAFVAGAVVGENWLLAASLAVLFAMVAAGMLRIGPFRRPPRTE